jgi:tetratricopeptide (TPR) repeat protein
LLAFLRASGWDSDFFLQCLPFLLDSLQEISWSGKEDVRRAVAEAWDAYFPIGDTSDAADLPSGFGVLLYTIGDYAEAMEYFRRSLQLVGMDARTTFNIALCLNRLGRLTEAADWIKLTLDLDPNSEQALAMRTTLAQEDLTGQ